MQNKQEGVHTHANLQCTLLHLGAVFHNAHLQINTLHKIHIDKRKEEESILKT